MTGSETLQEAPSICFRASKPTEDGGGGAADAQPPVIDRVWEPKTGLGTPQEAPSICFRASKPPEDSGGGGVEACALVAQRVALEVAERIGALQRGGRLPLEETCDLIVVDRCACRPPGPSTALPGGACFATTRAWPV